MMQETGESVTYDFHEQDDPEQDVETSHSFSSDITGKFSSKDVIDHSNNAQNGTVPNLIDDTTLSFSHHSISRCPTVGGQGPSRENQSPSSGLVNSFNYSHDGSDTPVALDSLINVIRDLQAELRQQSTEIRTLCMTVKSLSDSVNNLIGSQSCKDYINDNGINGSMVPPDSMPSRFSPILNANHQIHAPTADEANFAERYTKRIDTFNAEQYRANEAARQQQRFEAECRRREEERKRLEEYERKKREEEEQRKAEEQRRRQELDEKRKQLMTHLVGGDKSSLFGDERSETPRRSLFDD